MIESRSADTRFPRSAESLSACIRFAAATAPAGTETTGSQLAAAATAECCDKQGPCSAVWERRRRTVGSPARLHRRHLVQPCPGLRSRLQLFNHWSTRTGEQNEDEDEDENEDEEDEDEDEDEEDDDRRGGRGRGRGRGLGGKHSVTPRPATLRTMIRRCGPARLIRLPGQASSRQLARLAGSAPANNTPDGVSILLLDMAVEASALPRLDISGIRAWSVSSSSSSSGVKSEAVAVSSKLSRESTRHWHGAPLEATAVTAIATAVLSSTWTAMEATRAARGK